MYTQCPECLTIYKIAAETLQSSHGRFRCGHCGGVFDGLPSLTEKLPDGVIDELPRSNPAEVPAVLSVPAMRPVRDAAQLNVQIELDEFERPRAPDVERKEPTLPADWVVFRPDPVPNSGSALGANPNSAATTQGREQRYGNAGKASFELNPASAMKPSTSKAPARAVVEPLRFEPTERRITSTQESTPTGKWPWVVSAIFLTLALIAQLGFYQRRALLAHDDFRPWLDRACVVLKCKLPLREDLARFRVLESIVKPHPQVPGALLISASLRNDASFPQNFPVVEVKLSDTSARIVALRRFSARSYLRDAARISDGIATGASLPIIFEVLDPGSEAAGFEFNFLPGPDLRETSPPE